MTAFGVILLFLLVALFFAGLREESKNKSPVLLFYAALFVMFIVPTFGNILFGGKYPMWVYIDAAVFAVIYIAVFCLSRYLFTIKGSVRLVWLRTVFDKEKNEDVNYSWTFLMCTLVSLGLFIQGLGIHSFARALTLNWWELVHSGSSLVLAGTYFAYSASASLIVADLSRRDNRRGAYAVFLIVGLFLVFSVFVLKSRSYVLMFMVPYFIFLFYAGRLRVPRLAIYGSLIVFMFVLTRAVRHAENLSEFLELGILYYLGDAAEGAETSFVNAFYFFIYNGNAFPGFLENITLQRIFLFWLPSFDGWGKPADFSYYMHSAYFGTSVADGLSMHPTVFGDAYGNAGILGAFIYPVLLAAMFSLAESVVSLWHSKAFAVAVFAILSVNALTFARGAVYNAFMFSLLPMLVIIALMTVTKFFYKIR